MGGRLVWAAGVWVGLWRVGDWVVSWCDGWRGDELAAGWTARAGWLVGSRPLGGRLAWGGVWAVSWLVDGRVALGCPMVWLGGDWVRWVGLSWPLGGRHGWAGAGSLPTVVGCVVDAA